jgi:Ca2+-binding RTX toxin-like protein
VKLRLIPLCGALALAGLVPGTSSASATTPSCFGKPATIVGTPGDDYLGGTSDIDVIHAGAGDDIVVAGNTGTFEEPSAGDLVCGGPGNDILAADGVSNNRMSGGHGDDDVSGRRGVDILLGNAGNDRVYDVDDFDYPDDSDPGTDILRGGPGRDEVQTRCGSDRAYGGGGADHVTDYTAAKSYLFGGAGNDFLEAWYVEPEGDGPRMADIVSGDRDVDIAKVNRTDTVTASTERVTRVN